MAGERLGGRQKGTPNKTTKKVRDMLTAFVTDNAGKFQKEWEKINSPRDKAKIYLEACKYVLPALQSVTLTDETERNKTVEDALKALSEQKKQS